MSAQFFFNDKIFATHESPFWGPLWASGGILGVTAVAMLRMDFRGMMLEQGGVPGARGRRVAEAGAWLRRTVGEMLREREKQSLGEYQRLHDATVAPSYSDLGIEKTYAHRCQKLATVSEEQGRSRWIKTRPDAVNWIIENQLGRRNLTLEQRSYLRGRKYKERKKPQGARTDLTSPQNEERLTTAQEIAKEEKVSRATVERDEKFTEAIDLLTETVGDDATRKILARILRRRLGFQQEPSLAGL